MTDIIADRVTLSYPEDERSRNELETDTYRSYLRRARDGPVSPGDEWKEFVSRGCGAVRDVVLRVEAVDGGTTVGDTTEFEFVSR
ncbi:hypothetical protein [Halostella pelagica]|uniref:hypothetical protein n=1 Tax=Halostella pelagica TaxID=2583824 RepID=UPI00107FEE21|nr:hypothetical protein [Halostella pelagica]